MISWSGFNSIEKLLLLGLLTNISEGDVKQKCTCVVFWANMLRRCRNFLYKSQWAASMVPVLQKVTFIQLESEVLHLT